MLPVVHRFPGSSLNASQVSLVVPGWGVDDLKDHIDLAVTLASAVQAATDRRCA